MTRALVRDGVTYDARAGILATKWGLATVAVGHRGAVLQGLRSRARSGPGF